jgi:hypothetical protein
MPSVRAIRPRRRRTPSAAAALVLAACLLSSCGEDSNAELSQERASNLRAALNRVEEGVSGGDCTSAAEQASGFREEVASLPDRVDSGLRAALERSATRLESLVSEQCKPAAEEAPAQEAPAPDQNGGDQQQQDRKDQKPKKEKQPPEEEQPPGTGGTTGATGATGSTGATGFDGGTAPPEGG